MTPTKVEGTKPEKIDECEQRHLVPQIAWYTRRDRNKGVRVQAAVWVWLSGSKKLELPIFMHPFVPAWVRHTNARRQRRLSRGEKVGVGAQRYEECVQKSLSDHGSEFGLRIGAPMGRIARILTLCLLLSL